MGSGHSASSLTNPRRLDDSACALVQFHRQGDCSLEGYGAASLISRRIFQSQFPICSAIHNLQKFAFLRKTPVDCRQMCHEEPFGRHLIRHKRPLDVPGNFWASETGLTAMRHTNPRRRKANGRDKTADFERHRSTCQNCLSHETTGRKTMQPASLVTTSLTTGHRQADLLKDC